MRTATHAFKIAKGKTYERYSFDSKQEGWDGGFGRRILGETWISHHGNHGKQSTRGVIAPAMKDHPIVRGCEDIWGPTDVYTVRLPLPDDSKPLVLGQVLEGMKPTDKPVSGKERSDDAHCLDQDLPGDKGRPGASSPPRWALANDLESEGCAVCWSTPPTGAWAWKRRFRPRPTWISWASTSRRRSASPGTARASSRRIPLTARSATWHPR
jgi:hypothetical protein